MITKAILIIIVLFIVVAGSVLLSKQPVDPIINETQTETMQISNEEQNSNEEELIRYEKYDENLLSSGRNILFFHASWCPTCRALDLAISEDINDIPNDMVILKVDYDSATDLRVKYGVTTQHTLVQVNENGDLIKKWVGSRDINDLVKETQ